MSPGVKGAFGAILGLAIVAVVVFFGWHLWTDHRDHHAMVGMWNTYGLTIQGAHAKTLEQQYGSRGIKPAETSPDPVPALPAAPKRPPQEK